MRLLTDDANLELALKGYPISSRKWFGVGSIKLAEPYAFTKLRKPMYVIEFPSVLEMVGRDEFREQELRLATREEIADAISNSLGVHDNTRKELAKIITSNNVSSIKEKVNFFPGDKLSHLHDLLDLCKLALDEPSKQNSKIREMALSGYPVVSSDGFVGCFEQASLNKMFAKPVLFGDWRFTDQCGSVIKGDAEYLLKSVNPRLTTIDDVEALFDYALSNVHLELGVKLNLKDPDARSQIEHLIEEHPDYKLLSALVNMVGILEVTEKINSGELPAGRLFGELND